MVAVAAGICCESIWCKYHPLYLREHDKISLGSQDAQNDIRHRNSLPQQTVWFLNATARGENSNHLSGKRI